MPVEALPNGRWMPRCDVPLCGWQPRHGSRDEARARRYLSTHRSEVHPRVGEAVMDAARDACTAWRESPTAADTVEAMAHLESLLAPGARA